MKRGKAIFLAAAPLTALLLLAAGARLLPSASDKDGITEDSSIVPASSPRKTSPADARKPVDIKTQAVLQKVVGGQLNAFANDDFARALTYSAPGFRQMYTPDSFQQMVKAGFSGLLKYKKLRFVGAQGSADIATLPVFLKAEDGSETGYLYILRKDATLPLAEEKGTKRPAKADSWYIDGVTPIAARGYPERERVTDLREL